MSRASCRTSVPRGSEPSLRLRSRGWSNSSEESPGENVLKLLARRWSGPASFELERMLRESDIAVELRVWS